MTRAEAIDVLKRNYPSSCYEDLCKAVDIAIKALSAQQDLQQTCNQLATDCISRRDAVSRFLDLLMLELKGKRLPTWEEVYNAMQDVPSIQLEDYTEMKREFLRMASYIDVLLECSDVQKETLMGFISRLAEFMPWTERGEKE